MSRTKKSRKPGGAPTAKPKLSKVELANVEKRVRKKTGKKPGNRQQEAQPVKSSDQHNNQHKDPRIGSKKPIELGGSPKAIQEKSTNSTKGVKAKQDPIAALRTVSNNNEDVDLSLAEQLTNIEADEKLQVIIEKQEQEVALTQEEVEYFNTMMDRHQQISAQLDDEEEEETIKSTASSEDDLWDKLDNSSLSDDFYNSDLD